MLNLLLNFLRVSFWPLAVLKIQLYTFGMLKTGRLRRWKGFVDVDLLSWLGALRVNICWHLQLVPCLSKHIFTTLWQNSTTTLKIRSLLKDLGNTHLDSRELECHGGSCPSSCLESVWKQSYFCWFCPAYTLLSVGRPSCTAWRKTTASFKSII